MTTLQTATAIDFPDFDSRHSENSFEALVSHSLIHCKRLLFMWMRDGSTTIQALIYPALTLVMFWVVLGDQITSATGQPSIYGTTVMITLIAAMSGSMVTALGLTREAANGLLGRFTTMPVHRASGLVGRLLAEAARMLITTVLILSIGVALGFRFDQGRLAAIAVLGVPIIFGMAFAMFVTALATGPGAAVMIDIVSITTTILMFFNTGFVPIIAYPGWLRDIVANQPISCAVDAMKGLSLGGGPVTEPLLKTLGWSIGIAAVFAYPAVRGYARAARTGP